METGFRQADLCTVVGTDTDANRLRAISLWQQAPQRTGTGRTCRVNPNTMQKAFAELERVGLIQTMRTAGRFVTEDTLLIQNIRQSLAREQLAGFFQNMRQLGYQKEEILSFLKATYEEG